MSSPFLSEIKIMSFGFPPKGWAQCNGQLLPINQNQPLFSLLGTTYGGDGRVNFGLPNLQGNVAVGMNNGFTLGQRGGEAAHTLTIAELPQHSHAANASGATTVGSFSPNGNYLGGFSNFYNSGGTLTAMVANTIGTTGGSQPHVNQQPYLVLNFCIALQGIFPSQN
jgi:microcystin-dependent protein